MGGEYFKQYLRVASPQVLHTHGLRADYLSTKYGNEINNISTLHNYPYYDYTMTYGKILGKIMAWQHIWLLKQVSCPVIVSRTMANLVCRHGLYPQVIQNGVDDKKFYPAFPIEKQVLRKMLGLPQDKTILISLGHLNVRKDPLTVLRGFLASEVQNKAILVML